MYGRYERVQSRVFPLTSLSGVDWVSAARLAGAGGREATAHRFLCLGPCMRRRKAQSPSSIDTQERHNGLRGNAHECNANTRHVTLEALRRRKGRGGRFFDRSRYSSMANHCVPLAANAS